MQRGKNQLRSARLVRFYGPQCIYDAYTLADPRGGGQSGHALITVLGRGLAPLPRLQKELIKVGGSW